MSWVERSISDFGRVVTGKTPDTNIPEFFDGDYMFVTPGDLEFGNYYCTETDRTVSEASKNRFRNQFIPRDTIMFTCIGNTIGKCGISSAESMTNQQINSVIPNEFHDQKFIYYLLHHNREMIRSIGIGGGSAAPIINKSTFSSVKFSIPEKRQTQKKISSILAVYDEMIMNNNRRIALLKEAVWQLYKEWFVRHRFPGCEHVTVFDGVPNGWNVGNLGDVVVICKGRNITKSTAEQGEIPVVAGGLKPAYFHNVANVKGPVITVSASGANSGHVAIYLEDIWASDCSYISASDNPQIWFWHAVIKSCQTEITAMQHGAAQPHVYASQLKRIQVVIPPSQMIVMYQNYVEQYYVLIKGLQTQNKWFVKAQKLLLPKLMRGEISV